MIEAEEGGVEEALGYSPVKYSTSTMAPTALVLAAEHPQQQLLHDESVYGVQRVYKKHSPETYKCFLHLFGSLLEASGQHKDATAVPLERLPEEVRTELRDLFLPGKEGHDLVLDKNVMTQGLFDMTEAFISGHNRCRRINELRNAYFRNILMNIYVDNIQWTEEEEKLRARDVITINSCTRKLVEPTELEVSSPRTDASPQLLRSSSVGTEQVSGGGRSTLQEHLSPESSAALAKVVEMQGLTWDEQANLVWSLESQVTSKLRFNVVVQDLANMYLLTKLKRAYLVLRGATLAISPLGVGDRVVFVDYYFMPHLCTVTRARPGLVYDILLDAGREVRNIPRVDLEPSSAPKPADVSLVGIDAAALKPGDVDAVDDAVPMDDQLSPAALPPPVPVDNVAWEVRYADAEAAIAPLLETALAGAHVPRIHDPTPKNYYLFFTEDGVRKEFYFDNRDIGLKFGELYAHCGVPAAVLEEHPRVVRETNRCFFLHLGLATGLNPFKLQACFRSEARRQRGAAVANLEAQINAAVAAAEAAPNSTPEERLAQQALEEEATRLFLESPTDLFDSVLQEGAMVDMEVLTKIWPAELSDIRICLVPLYYSRYSSETLDNIICYTPLNSACHTADGWTGRDIVMKRLGAHFTWLAAPADTVELHGAEPLIDRFLRNMRNCESPVIMRDVSIQYDLHV